MNPTPALDTWRELTSALGLGLAASSGTLRWIGTYRRVDVTIEALATPPSGHLGVRVAVAIPRPDLVVIPAALALDLTHRRLIGEPLFDDAIVLIDPDPAIHALLDIELRGTLHTLVGRGVVILGGALRLDPWATALLAPDTAAATVLAMIDVAAKAAAMTPEAAAEALVAIIEEDVIDGVRVRCEAVADQIPGVAAARGLVSGRGSVESSWARLVAHIDDPRLTLDSRAGALRRLQRLFPIDRWAALVERLHADRSALDDVALDGLCDAAASADIDAHAAARLLATYIVDGFKHRTKPHATTALLATTRLDMDPMVLLRLLGPAWDWVLKTLPTVIQRGTGQSGDLLAALLPSVRRDLPLTTAYLRAFQRLGDPRWSALVTEECGSEYDGIPEVAFEVLADIGDLAAIRKLKPLTEGLFRSNRDKELARVAIDAIRARHGAAFRPGALSLADTSAGALSLAADDPTED